jgi:glycine/D-amino acid oxidase-like deaminating enzyme
MHTDYDVIVVGAGLSGLVAGATATLGGARTVVLEAHQPGGRASSREREGFMLNLGPHALYLGGPGAAILAQLGALPAGAAPPLRRYRALWSDGRLSSLPTGPLSLARCSGLGRGGRLQLLRVMQALPKMDAQALAGQSLDGWLASLDLGPDPATMIRALVRLSTYTADSDRLDAGAVVAQLQLALKGVRYLDGGWQRLVSPLVAKVEVQGHRKVSTLEPVGDGVEVRTEDGRLTARHVVVAAGAPRATRSLLPEDPQWGDLGSPVTAACLDVGVLRVPAPGYVLGIEEPLYATTTAPPAAMAPAGAAVVSVIRYGAGNAADDRADLQAYLGHAGVTSEDVVVERFLAHMTVAGTLPEARRGGLHGRPDIDATGQAAISVAGDWVGPHGMLAEAAVVSGERAGRRALAALDRAPAVQR